MKNTNNPPPWRLLSLQDLRFTTVIGVGPDERETPQELSCDLALWLTEDPDESLGRTVDYAALTPTIQAYAALRRDRLLETFTEKLADCLWESLTVWGLSLTVHKKPADLKEHLTRVSMTVLRPWGIVWPPRS